MKYWRTPIDAEDYVIPHGEVHILSNRCKGCGFCIEFCPRSVLIIGEAFNERGYHPPVHKKDSQCVNCGLCELICPEFAIFTMKVDDSHGSG